MNGPIPIPLRADPSARARANVAAFMRCVTAHVIAKVEGVSADKIAMRMWPQDREAGWLVRAAAGPTTTGSAPALLETLMPDFIASLTPISAAATLLRQTLQLQFDGAASISAPGFIADTALVGFVAEGAAIPVRALNASPLRLEPAKLATIAALTREMVSAGNAQALVTDVLTRSAGLALDAALFDAEPAVDDLRPAGLRNGIAASTASADQDADQAMLADIATLLGIIAPISGAALPVLIAAPARAITMRMRVRNMPLIVLASGAIAAGDLLAVVPSAIVSATDSVPQITVSFESALHMDDTPQPIGQPGEPPVVAAPTRSLFQTETLAIKTRIYATWARRDPRAVAWLTATKW